jgi:hypothetical protein
LFSTNEYLEACFHYVHGNPLVANLVNDLKNWPYSSYPDYFGFRTGTLCNKQKLMDLLSYTQSDFKKPFDIDFNQPIFKNIF